MDSCTGWTSLLNNSLNSGDITRESFSFHGVGTVNSGLTLELDATASGDLPLSVVEFWICFRWCAAGAGKLFFLSIASTVRSKRRKRDSARVRMGMSSIVLESSLTVHYVRRGSINKWDKVEERTVLQDLVEVLQVIHNDVSVLLEDSESNKYVEIA